MKKNMEAQSSSELSAPPIDESERNAGGHVKNALEQNALAVAIYAIPDEEKNMLEYLYLHGMSLKQAAEKSGMVYNSNSGIVRKKQRNQAYITHLIERQKIFSEFGVDDPMIVQLVKIRDTAHMAGQGGAAVRAHEICMKSVGRLKADEKKPEGDAKPVDDMSREEVIAEIQELTSKAGLQLAESKDENLEVQTEELKAAMRRSPQSTHDKLSKNTDETDDV